MNPTRPEPSLNPTTNVASTGLAFRGHHHLWLCQGGCELPVHKCAEARPTVERLEALEALFAAAQRLNAFATWSALGRPETEAFLAALDRAAAASAPKEAGE